MKSTLSFEGAAVRRPPPSLPKPNDSCWCGSGQKYKKCHKETDYLYLRDEAKSLDAGRIKQGVISPRRTVPDNIPRPDYAVTGVPGDGTGRLVRTADELVRMRRACKAAAHVLQVAGAAVKAGVTTDELDALAHETAIKLGGYPSPLNYGKTSHRAAYPKSICTSVNEIICHGIPDSRKLVEGDICNIDVTVFLDGMHGDTNATFFVGVVDDESQRLVRVTRECMMVGIAAVKVGRPVSDIGRAIEQHADAHGFSVVRNYCGHGIGDVFHNDLQIPHYFDARSDEIMEPDMTFTIEPMINAGTHQDRLWSDNWTAVTVDLKRSAQFEHTILVTDKGAEILTVVD